MRLRVVIDREAGNGIGDGPFNGTECEGAVGRRNDDEGVQQIAVGASE